MPFIVKKHQNLNRTAVFEAKSCVRQKCVVAHKIQIRYVFIFLGLYQQN